MILSLKEFLLIILQIFIFKFLKKFSQKNLQIYSLKKSYTKKKIKIKKLVIRYKKKHVSCGRQLPFFTFFFFLSHFFLLNRLMHLSTGDRIILIIRTTEHIVVKNRFLYN